VTVQCQKCCWFRPRLILKQNGLTQVKPETLHDAAKLGDKEAAEALIAEGAEVNTKDKRGITPLGVAVSTSAQPLILLLIVCLRVTTHDEALWRCSC